MERIKTFIGGIIAAIIGLLGIFFVSKRPKDNRREDLIEPLVVGKKKELRVVEEQIKKTQEELDKVRKESVKDKTPEDVIDYWRKQ